MATEGQLKEKCETSLEYDIISDGPFDGKWISQWKTLRGVNEVPIESQFNFQGWSVNRDSENTEYWNFRKTLDKEFYLNNIGDDVENILCMQTLEDSALRLFAIETTECTPFEGEVIDTNESYFIRFKDTTRYIATDNKDEVLKTTDPGNAVPWKFIPASNESKHKIVKRKMKKRRCNIS